MLDIHQLQQSTRPPSTHPPSPISQTAQIWELQSESLKLRKEIARLKSLDNDKHKNYQREVLCVDHGENENGSMFETILVFMDYLQGM